MAKHVYAMKLWKEKEKEELASKIVNCTSWIQTGEFQKPGKNSKLTFYKVNNEGSN